MTQDNVRVAPAWDRPDPQVLQRFREHSVANLGDALDRLNIVDGGISPVWHGAKAVGTALPVLTVAGDNKAVIAALDHIRPGDILVINAFGYDGRAIVGDNLAQRFDVFGAVGAVVDGYVRDGAIIEKLGVPV
ncbi:RraA family protein, partial [Streptomyces sp. NPDC058656]